MASERATVVKIAKHVADVVVGSRGNSSSTGTSCTCGHAVEEHGNDPEYPGSTSCSECDCIAYESEG